MLASTLLLTSLAALVVATPGGKFDRDGDEIRFKDVKKINDDKFKKTNFDVHDAREHDKNFNNVEFKDKDVLKKVDFRKDDDDFDFGFDNKHNFDRKHDYVKRWEGKHDNDDYGKHDGKFRGKHDGKDRKGRGKFDHKGKGKFRKGKHDDDRKHDRYWA